MKPREPGGSRKPRVLRPGILIALVAVCLCLAVPTIARAQDTLSRVRTLYESADYEQALQVLLTLKGPAATTEAAAYRVFCLMALGRTDEARAAVESIVRADPMFHPPAGQVSPRVRQFFDDVRKPLLADVARQSYAKAKVAYDKKDWATARDGFARVVGVLDDLNSTDAGLADMKTVATGFRDLAVAAIQAEAAAAGKLTLAPMMTPTPTPTATPKPTPTPTPTSAPDASPVATPAPTPSPRSSAAPAVYSDADTDVAKPLVLTRAMPTWRPTPVELKMTFTGTLELLVNEEGRVLSASLLKSIHPRYDATLLAAAQNWTFQPATRNGAPVRYRYVMTINLTGPIK